MGSTQSSMDSASSNNSGSVGCFSPRPRFGQLFTKLRRSLMRHLRPRKRRSGFQRGCGARTALLRPMPRCSSFGSCSTLLTPSKKQKQKKSPADNNYAQWKSMFEHESGKRVAPPNAQRLHDISEALSGQTTPRGFPSHTDTRRCPLLAEQQPPIDVDTNVRRRLSFRLPSGSQGSVRRLSARQKAAQAKLEAQLQRELCDLEEYYGAFHYARRNERRI